jgi:hypothetical protein
MIRISSRMKLNWVMVRKTSTANPTSHSHGESAVTMRPPSRNPIGMRLNRLRRNPVWARARYIRLPVAW